MADPAFVSMRLTASDRPGVAQPVPVRDIPPRPWRLIFLVAVAISTALVAAWELYWRNFGVVPGYRNSDGQWAEQRRRIDHGEGGKTVLIGASRVLFDTQLQVWEKITGDRPIQLALEGTSPIPVLKDLADDPDFTGRLLIDVSPDVFFSGFAYRGDAVSYAHTQGPSQRIGDWLSMTFLEPYLAFYDPDFALATVVRRQAWPERPGRPQGISVRKLAVHERDRNTHMWAKVANDPEYRALARRIWAQDFADPLPNMETPEKKQKAIDEQIQLAADALTKLRARGVMVLFIRPPSDGEYYAFEQRELPRAITWDLLLQRTGSAGIHFEDYPEMQGYELPEWSHIAEPDALRYTAAVVPIIEREFARLDAKPASVVH
ncbi:MAG: hypothetical protein ACREPX_04625 [Rhodanobacteraceae bacterium]